MCITADFSKVLISKNDQIVWKVVRKSKTEKGLTIYSSIYVPHARRPQGRHGYGELLHYKLGEPIHQQFGKTYGIYCYLEPSDPSKLYAMACLLKAKVPAGVKYVLGKVRIIDEDNCINAETIIPLEELSYVSWKGLGR